MLNIETRVLLLVRLSLKALHISSWDLVRCAEHPRGASLTRRVICKRVRFSEITIPIRKWWFSVIRIKPANQWFVKWSDAWYHTWYRVGLLFRTRDKTQVLMDWLATTQQKLWSVPTGPHWSTSPSYHCFKLTVQFNLLKHVNKDVLDKPSYTQMNKGTQLSLRYNRTHQYLLCYVQGNCARSETSSTNWTNNNMYWVSRLNC